MTNLVRFTAGDELRRMQREFDRLFESFFPVRDGNGDVETAVWTPRVDLVESPDAYLIHLDVPGMKKEDFNINYQEGVLTVSGERRAETKEEQQNLVRVERSFGHFFRSFSLPKAIKDSEIAASYKEGVLTVHVPKAEETKPRRIQIK